ncbi:MAG TPA: cupin domain-containing protein [Chloroflexota bacterium]|nr:cupin domain-containing protein [Chloroflexota bacterium]
MRVVNTKVLPRDPVNAPLFTGTQVYRQEIINPSDSQTFNFSIVNFSAGSRNKMHTHTSDQILIVTEGTGVVANEMKEHTISVGDVVLIPAGEKHWHGAPGDTPMSHITVQAKGSQTTQVEP